MIGAYRRVQAAVGLPKINFHEARHSFSSWLLNKRKSPFMVMEALGHKTIGMTLQDYKHTEIEAVRGDVSSLDLGIVTEDDFPEPIGEA